MNMTMLRVFAADVSPLDNDVLFSRFLSLMPADRQEKVRAFRFRKDKNLSLGAGILLMHGLRTLGYGASAPLCAMGPNGKPFFPTLPEVHFNLSHSGTMVLAAFAEGAVGCDVESIRDISTDIAKRFFCREEYALIMAQPAGEARELAFFRLWTLKESFMKALGMGMSLPMDEFCIRADSGEITVDCPQFPGEYRFREYNVFPGYCAACCMVGTAFPPEAEIIDLQMI